MEGIGDFIIFVLLTLQPVLSRPPKGPICTSHDGLCAIRYEIMPSGVLAGDMNKFISTSQICSCPGKRTCPTANNDTVGVAYQMTSSDQTIAMELIYCKRKTVSKRLCNDNEVAMTLRGSGPVITEVVGDVTCRCSTPLTLHRAYPDGVLSVREYSCNKPLCDVNNSNPPVCELVTTALSLVGYSLTSEILCLCPGDYHCYTQTPENPLLSGQTTQYHCEMRPAF